MKLLLNKMSYKVQALESYKVSIVLKGVSKLANFFHYKILNPNLAEADIFGELSLT
jgi:hypothetical protein